MKRISAFIIILLLLTFELSAQIHGAYLSLDRNELCLNDTVNITSEFLPTVVDSMILDFGTGVDTTILNPTNAMVLPFIYDTAGYFTIKLTAYLDAESKSDSLVIDVYNYPSPYFSDDFFPYLGLVDTFYYSNRRFIFVANEYNPMAIHAWHINEEMQMSQNDSMVYNFPNVGSYLIEHTIELNGCTSFTSRSVEIKEEDVKIPNVFTPNGDGKNDVFYVQTDGNTKYSFTVWNRHGGRVFLIENRKVVSWDGYSYWGELLHPGTYYYVLESELGDVHKGFIYLSR